MAMKYTFLNPGESVLMEGSANMQQFLGVNKGGKLILTNQRLVFIAHALNIGSKFDEIPLSAIAVSGNSFNVFVPTPNMIKVVTTDGSQYQFVVTKKQRDEWVQNIYQAAMNLRSMSSSGNSATTRQSNADTFSAGNIIPSSPPKKKKSCLKTFLIIAAIIGVFSVIVDAASSSEEDTTYYDEPAYVQEDESTEQTTTTTAATTTTVTTTTTTAPTTNTTEMTTSTTEATTASSLLTDELETYYKNCAYTEVLSRCRYDVQVSDLEIIDVDDYGRVCAFMKAKIQNGFGAYQNHVAYVVVQCTDAEGGTFQSSINSAQILEGNQYDEYWIDVVKELNHWNEPIDD